MSPNKLDTAGPSEVTGKTWEQPRELEDRWEPRLGGRVGGIRVNVLRCEFEFCLVNMSH